MTRAALMMNTMKVTELAGLSERYSNLKSSYQAVGHKGRTRRTSNGGILYHTRRRLSYR